MDGEEILNGGLSLLGLNGFFTFLLVLAIPIFLIGGAFKVLNGGLAHDTRQRVDIEALHFLQSEGTSTHYDDCWGNKMTYTYQEGKLLRIATVTSAGKDKKMGTDDDIIGRAEDVNKSRVAGQKAVQAGKWLGGKAKEFGKGVIDGVKGE